MFSWSNNRSRPEENAYTYPGNRASSTSPVARAPVIQGTIRGPSSQWQQQQQQNGGRSPSSSSSSPSYSASGYKRQQHLDSYLQDATLSRSTRKCANVYNAWDTVFQTVNGETLKLRVQLIGSHLSVTMEDPPRMSLAGVRASHGWLDSSGGGGARIVGYPVIANREAWQRSNATLGAIVHEIVKHLQLHPPKVEAFTDARLYSMQSKTIQERVRLVDASPDPSPRSPPPPDYFSAFQQQQQPSHSNGGSSGPPPPLPSFEDTDVRAAAENMSVPRAVEMPPIPTTFDDLGDDREFLDDILRNEVELISYCNGLPVMDEVHTLSMSVAENNAKIAKEHVKEEPTLKQLHEKAHALRDELQRKVEEFQERKKRQDAMCAPPDVRTVMRRLQDGKKRAYDASEKIAEEWVDDGNGSVDDFCTKFLQQRKLHHLCGVKLELLTIQQQELLTIQQQQQQQQYR